jgi:effector-binding domain-containing protein
MNAKPEKIYNYVSNMHNFNEWSPWHKIDSTTQYTFDGPESGVGSSMSWKSNNSDVGEGRQVIAEAVPNDLVKLEMYFMESDKPAYGTYQMEPDGEGTKFTWSLDADMGMNPFMRWMGLMMGMVGKMFDQGLADLKIIVEQLPGRTTDNIPVELTTNSAGYYLAVRDTASIATIGMKLGQAYGMIMESAKKQKLNVIGSPFAIYYTESTTNWEMDVALPVNKPGKEDGLVKPGEMKAGNVVVAHYMGAYEGTPAGHEAAYQFIKANNQKIMGPPWEVYITDPTMEKDTAKWKTDIIYPVE